MSEPNKPKTLVWLGDSRKRIRELPARVQDEFGHALWLAQLGGKHDSAKLMQGFGGGSVVELIEDHDGDTYRAVYTVQFAGFVYVLHVFQKKSKQGIKTPKPDLAIIKKRLSDLKTQQQKRGK